MQFVQIAAKTVLKGIPCIWISFLKQQLFNGTGDRRRISSKSIHYCIQSMNVDPVICYRILLLELTS